VKCKCEQRLAGQRCVQETIQNHWDACDNVAMPLEEED
jgi:hypothetical protein